MSALLSVSRVSAFGFGICYATVKSVEVKDTYKKKHAAQHVAHAGHVPAAAHAPAAHVDHHEAPKEEVPAHH